MEELTIKNTGDLKLIPKNLFPMMVFSDGIGSLFASLITAKEKGVYNHFFWLLDPETGVSQDTFFRRVSIAKYMRGKHSLKFIYSKDQPQNKMILLRNKIEIDLKKPWYKRIYDPLAILGQAINCCWIQIPGIDICSDKAKFIKYIDPRFDLKHPSPTDVNIWTKKTPGYAVWGRYRLD